jgi:UPF0148 protein
MKERKDDEIMADYLLKGGRMLEKCCTACGCPLFDYKGKTFCVVCAEKSGPAGNAGQPAVPSSPPAGGTPAEAAAGAPAAPELLPPFPEAEMLARKIAQTIHELCQRIKAENDPERCLMLMDAVKSGTEALEMLRKL